MCAHMLLHYLFFFFVSSRQSFAPGYLSSSNVISDRNISSYFLGWNSSLCMFSSVLLKTSVRVLALRVRAQCISDVCYRTCAWAVKLSKNNNTGVFVLAGGLIKAEPANVRLSQRSNLWQNTISVIEWS